MVAGGRARLRLKEAVVRDVECGQAHAEPGEADLAPCPGTDPGQSADRGRVRDGGHESAPSAVSGGAFAAVAALAGWRALPKIIAPPLTRRNAPATISAIRPVLRGPLVCVADTCMEAPSIWRDGLCRPREEAGTQ